MILVVNDYDSAYSRFWSHLGGEITHDPAVLFADPGSIKLVCFTGGEDVSPELYGHKNLGSHNSKARDEREVLIFEMAKKHKIPMTGICRGSQFLNVMCGGTMIQHLGESHGGSLHRCETVDGKTFQVTSSHHQMVVPGEGGEILACAAIRVTPGSCAYDGELPAIVMEEDEEGRYVRVTEAFCYPEYRVFAVQHHPEWQGIDEEAPQWTLDKIAEFCWGQEIRTKSLDEVMEVFGA
jgi:anthranilate/para-aminobenzoate synthase component II